MHTVEARRPPFRLKEGLNALAQIDLPVALKVLGMQVLDAMQRVRHVEEGVLALPIVVERKQLHAVRTGVSPSTP